MGGGETMEETHTLVLTKLAERSLQDKVIAKNRDALIAKVNTRSLTIAGWTLEADMDLGDWGHGGRQGWKQLHVTDNGAAYKYEMYLKLSFSHRDKAPDKNIFAAMCRSVFTSSSQAVLGRWTLTTVDGKEYVPPEEGAIPLSDDFIGYTEVVIPDNFETYFEHLYGLDAHVKRIKKALEAGLMSNWTNRFNCGLIGPPGCGKSDVCQSLKRALGEEAVLEFDATATTAAGAIKELAEREILPRIIVVEEIEKADEKAMSFLLAALDLRAEIRKTTARATIQRDTKLFAVATVNNHELFFRQQAGALASRFSNKIWFKRPTREMLGMILEREVSKVQGDFAWIEPTLDWCDEADITDPRQVITICLCGREELVTGEYQNMLRETSEDMPMEFDLSFA